MDSEKIKNKLMTGGFWAFIGKFSTSFMSLAINAILARYLSPGDLGVYFIAFNLAMISAYFGVLGLEQTTLKYVADNMGKKAYANVIYMVKFAFLSSLIGAVIVGAFYYFGAHFILKDAFQSIGLYSIILPLIGWITAHIFQILLGETFRGFQDIRSASLFGGVISTFIFLAAFFISSSYMQVEMTLSVVLTLWIGSIMFSSAIGLFVLLKKLYAINKMKVDHDKRALQSRIILSTSIPFLVVGVSIAFHYQIDLWIVQYIGNQEDVALYGVAAKLTTIIGIPLMIVNAVVTPMISEHFAQGKLKDIESMLRFTGTLSTIAAGGCVLLFILFGGPILSILFGSFYGNAALLLILLSLRQMVVVWNGVCSTIMAMAGQEKFFMKFIIISTVISAFVALGLGYFWGINGVAIGFLLVNVFSQIYLWYRLKKALNIRADADFIGTLEIAKQLISKRKESRKAVS